MSDWKPFRPTDADLRRIAGDVAAIPEIQKALRENHPDIHTRDRVAHQYQIAGGRVDLTVAEKLPPDLEGVGLFEPGSRHIGVGRVSTGLGCPHLETDPDFLGLMLAFRTRAGRRVDFLTINAPGAPTDTHGEFMKLLEATADGAGAEPLFGSGLGTLDLFDLLASNVRVVRSLVGSLGLRTGGGIALHIVGQTLRTAKSSTAYQNYWTGIVEVGGVPGKFLLAPLSDENRLRALSPGERHLSEDWRKRQAAGAVEFDLFWLPYIDETATPLRDLTEPWEERAEAVGRVTFPQADWRGETARRWAALAAEMGANPGNWVHDRDDSVPEPATEFACARKIAYRRSQEGRDVLPEALYDDVFRTGEIDENLAATLKARRLAKRGAGHVDMAPEAEAG